MADHGALGRRKEALLWTSVLVTVPVFVALAIIAACFHFGTPDCFNTTAVIDHYDLQPCAFPDTCYYLFTYVNLTDPEGVVHGPFPLSLARGGKFRFASKADAEDLVARHPVGETIGVGVQTWKGQAALARLDPEEISVGTSFCWYSPAPVLIQLAQLSGCLAVIAIAVYRYFHGRHSSAPAQGARAKAM